MHASRTTGSRTCPASVGDADRYGHGRKRLLRETQALALFREPDIVRVTGYGEPNDTGHFVRHDVDGEPLDRRLRRPVSLDENAGIRIAARSAGKVAEPSAMLVASLRKAPSTRAFRISSERTPMRST